jgi:prevent-host-death family protein
MDVVGVRDLRQNLSTYLRRVAAGERFVVTHHREAMAVLTPLPESDDPWEQLLRERWLAPSSADLLGVGAPIALEDPYAGSTALQEHHGDEVRYGAGLPRRVGARERCGAGPIHSTSRE